MNLKEQFYYKKVEYLSGIYDKSLSFIVNTENEFCRPPLFIMGSGRNGSTLISSILNNHSEIFIPPENNIIPFTIKYWHRNPFKTWGSKLERIFKELEKPSMWNVDFNDLRLRLNTVPADYRNVNYVLCQIYLEYAMQHKRGDNLLWGDKTPSNTIYAHIIKKQFKGSKTLFLLRDPRAVISSLLEVNHEYYIKRVNHMIWRWKCSLNKYKEIKNNDPNSAILIKYEEFVSSPNEKLQEIISWIGLEFESNMLDNSGKNMSLLGVSDAKHHENIKNKVTPSYVNKWKSKLSPEIISYIEQRLKTEMKEYNYI